tara:strand:+ start:264 stop:1229 length:966 start_codon:yes stop_codon:yes gene_type:complete
MTNNIKYEWPYKGSKLINKQDLKPFLKRSNIDGLFHLSLHFLLILFTGTVLFFSLGTYFQYPIILFHGIFIAFLYAGLHECIHKTAFKNRLLNEVVGHFIGFILLRSFLNGRYRHMAHHTFTQHPDKDPDIVNFPKNYLEYIKHITSLTIWWRLLDNIVRHIFGFLNKQEKEYIPKSEINNLIKESRIMMLGYFFIFSISIYYSSYIFLIYWIIPRIIGEPFLRLIRMVEHTGKEESANMIKNTRTSHASNFLKFIYWNMPFHVEHHLYANVPFYRLKKFHKFIKPHTSEFEPSILSVHVEILKQIWINKKNNKKKNLLKI